MPREEPPPLRLQFPASEISRLSTAYKLDQKEKSALAAGERILNGDFSRDNLGPIFKWKVNDRGKSRPLKNKDEEVSDALRLAVAAQTPRSAIAVLTGLSGVAVPVASAILTAIKPDQFTVIDFRALEALGRPPARSGIAQYMSIGIYLEYLSFCQNLARECDVTLRELDRALWQWSKDHGTAEADATGLV